MLALALALAVAQQVSPPPVRPSAAAGDTAQPAAGQRLEAGPRAGYDWGLNAVSVGGELRVPILPGLFVSPSGDLFLRGPATPWQLNLDLVFRLGWLSGLFGGAGLALAHRADVAAGARTGLDVFIEYTPPRLGRRRLRPFVQARALLIGNRSPVQVQAGFDVRLGR